MSKKERQRKVILEYVSSGHFTLVEAAQRLGLSYRHIKRINRRYKLNGDKGLVHMRRGCVSNYAKPPSFKEQVLALYKANYNGFGPTFAAEKLAAQGCTVHHDTLRRWLISSGLWTKERNSPKHRSRRLRRAQFGELVQMDGSIHKWFGDDKPFCCLMNLVDDATGTTFALLADGETTEIAMMALRGWIETYGIPKALYVDLKNLYVGKVRLTDEELVEINQAFSIFKQACNKLGIEIIKAYSPQAKGRVERNHQVYQDRLVKEIKLQKLTQISQVNELLQGGFVAGLNKRFAKQAADSKDAHRPAPAKADLYDIFIWDAARCLHKDYTIRFNNQWYQIAKTSQPVRTGTTITVRRHLDNQLSLWSGDKKLDFHCLGSNRPVAAAPDPKMCMASEIKAVIARVNNKRNSPWHIYNPNWLKSKHKATAIAAQST